MKMRRDCYKIVTDYVNNRVSNKSHVHHNLFSVGEKIVSGRFTKCRYIFIRLNIVNKSRNIISSGDKNLFVPRRLDVSAYAYNTFSFTSVYILIDLKYYNFFSSD